MWKLLTLAAIIVVGFVAFSSSVSSLAFRDDGGAAGLAGTYEMPVNVREDVDEHHKVIQMPSTMPLEVILEGPDVVIDGPFPWVPVSGTFAEGEFIATGAGMVAGFQDIAVIFQGTVTPDGPVGNYWMGTEGGLPGGNYINYEVKPPDKAYSITVLKLDAANNQPLAGWEFDLYAGDCDSSDFIGTGVTEADGIFDFLGLAPGLYSVDEIPQAGWNVVPPEDECQEVEVPGTAGGPAGPPPCPIQPDALFPQPGCDTFDSGARVIIGLNGSEITFPVTLNGPTQIVRSNKPTDVGGLDQVLTEIVSLELSGGGVSVSLSSDIQSLGAITEQENSNQGTMDFPADSFFDVFFEVDLGGPILHNNEPLHLECKIDEIPPIGCFYQPPIGDPLILYDVDQVKVATIEHALHIPLPPKEVLVVFTNEQKPDVTPTPTPPEKLYSITVLKLDADNNQPLPGWEFELYAGGCSSPNFVADGVTDSDGIYDFLGLAPGLYSVDEIPQAGWNVVPPEDECQEVEVPGTAGGPAGLPPCPIQPDALFPQPGCDTFDSGARVIIRLNGSDTSFPVTLNGPTQIVRSNKPTNVGGLDQIETEIVSMELSGGGVSVSLSTEALSLGAITEQENSIPGTMDFPADSFFDVFFEVDLGGPILHNNEPLHLECKIDEIPPIGCLYQPPIDDPIVLYDANNVKIATIEHAIHIPLPPKEMLVVFTNERKDASGDVSCDGITNSIDGLFILQYIALLLDALPCDGSADVNGDGVTNALDVLLILQFDAGLLPFLPFPGPGGADASRLATARLPW